MDVIALLDSGALHRAARANRPTCVDRKGSIHVSPERAAFVDWLCDARAAYGESINEWPSHMRVEFAKRYTPSH